MDLTEEQWKIVEPILPEDPVHGTMDEAVHGVIDAKLSMVFYGFYAPAHRGRTCRPDMVRTKTSHRRFQQLGAFGGDGKTPAHAGATSQGRWRVGFERMFCGRDVLCRPKKGGDWWGKPSGARGPRSWALQTAMVFLSPCGQKALRRLEVKCLWRNDPKERFVADVPERLIGDKAYATATGWMNVCCKTSERS